jgi:acyl carrier protein
MDIAQDVRAFILTNFYVADPEGFSDEDSLISSGIVDSTGILEVIGFLESELGIRVEDGDVTMENLGTIRRIAAFAARKLAADGPRQTLTGS